MGRKMKAARYPSARGYSIRRKEPFFFCEGVLDVEELDAAIGPLSVYAGIVLAGSNGG